MVLVLDLRDIVRSNVAGPMLHYRKISNHSRVFKFEFYKRMYEGSRLLTTKLTAKVLMNNGSYYSD